MMYKYGMRLRPCGIACQPKGFTECLDGDKKYWNYLLYDRKLTDEETKNYDLDYIPEKENTMTDKAFIADMANEEIIEVLANRYDEDLMMELLDRAEIEETPTEATAADLVEKAKRILLADQYEDEESEEE